jgi:hypothetical protein
MSHGDGLAVLSTMPISMEDMSDNRIEDLLRILLKFLGVTCGNAESFILTNAYLLGDEKVTISAF